MKSRSHWNTKTPALKKRIEAMKSLQASGWPVGLRFDPVIYADDYRDIYAQLFEQVFSALDIASIHSTTLGTFRLPQHFFSQSAIVISGRKTIRREDVD